MLRERARRPRSTSSMRVASASAARSSATVGGAAGAAVAARRGCVAAVRGGAVPALARGVAAATALRPARRRRGSTSVKVLPAPGVLSSSISPPSSRASSREIDSPRPVPPNLRLVVPSAWRKASKIDLRAAPSAMPMPVSRTAKRDRRRRGAGDAQRDLAALGELERVRQQVLAGSAAAAARRCRWSAGTSGVDRRRGSASCFWLRQRLERLRQRLEQLRRRGRVSRRHLHLARLDLRQIEDVVDQRRAGRCRPSRWSAANLTCSGVRLPSRLSASSLARISELLSGVRSSCDMLARNSDL